MTYTPLLNSKPPPLHHHLPPFPFPSRFGFGFGLGFFAAVPVRSFEKPFFFVRCLCLVFYFAIFNALLKWFIVCLVGSEDGLLILIYMPTNRLNLKMLVKITHI